MKFNNPRGGTASSIGPQAVTDFHLKKAIVTARQTQFFTQLSSTQNMPKNFGKTMTVFEYVPLLDDRNVNDQGLDAAGATIANGNLYGSSKDVGTITGKLPLLTENGGRVNRVGFTRLEREGSLIKLGFFHEFTKETMDFDSDEDLMGYLATELLNGASSISEDLLQKELLLGAGVVVYAGAAVSNATVTAEGAGADIVSYDDLVRLGITLDDNRTPKQTKVITGSRLVDTRTIQSGRVMYIGSELQLQIEQLADSFGEKAFIPVHKYADAGNVLIGEIGAIGPFRLVVVPEMMHWDGAGVTPTSNPGYRVGAGGKYNVYPMLVVGDDAFVTIGFQTDGKVVKFKITTKMPGDETADRNDPYGEMGFSSIKWYYGTLIKRSERIAVLKTVAKQ